MVLLSVAHSGARRARARKAHVGTLGPLKAKCSSSSSLVFGLLWPSLAMFGKDAKLSTKAPLALLGTAADRYTYLRVRYSEND